MSDRGIPVELKLGIEGLDEVERLIDSAYEYLADAESAVRRARETSLSIVVSSSGGLPVRIGGIEPDSSAS